MNSVDPKYHLKTLNTQWKQFSDHVTGIARIKNKKKRFFYPIKNSNWRGLFSTNQKLAKIQWKQMPISNNSN